jgi:hypothetical protein
MIQPVTANPLDIQDRTDAFFGVVELCQEVSISALISKGWTREQAVAEWHRLRYEAFLKRERPPFSRRFPKAGLWKDR